MKPKEAHRSGQTPLAQVSAVKAVPDGPTGAAVNLPETAPRVWLGRGWLFGLLLVLATLIAYQPAWHGKLVWDDDQHLTKPALRSLPGLISMWTKPGVTQQVLSINLQRFLGATQAVG